MHKTAIVREDLRPKLEEAARAVEAQLGKPEIAVVLGSGLGPFANTLEDLKEIPYGSIPHMPKVSVEGHDGRLVAGITGGRRIFCFSGRVHSYEGIPFSEVCFCALLMAAMGCKIYVVTNAAGGSMPGMYPGCFMAIRDHIRFVRTDPLQYFRGSFLDDVHLNEKDIWSPRLLQCVHAAAKAENIETFEGIYGWTSGPSYETPTEVEIATKFGASSFGMSTVPEAIIAKAAGMEVLGISMITNLGAGLLKDVQLNHTEVKDIASQRSPVFQALLRKTIELLPSTSEPVQPQADASSKQPTENYFHNSETVIVTEQPVLESQTSFMTSSDPEPAAVLQYTRAEYLKSIADFIVHSPEYMKDAASFVADRLAKAPVHPIALVLSKGHFDIVKMLQSQTPTPITLADIPHFRTVSPSPASGKRSLLFSLSSSLTSNSNMLIFYSESFEGYNIEEATFVAMLAKQLGVKMMLTTLIAGRPESAQRSDAVIVKDLLNYVAVDPLHLAHFCLRPVENELSKEVVSKELVSFVSGLFATVPAVETVTGVTGPLFPTSSEIRLLKELNPANFMTITNLASLFISRYIGLAVLPFATVVNGSHTLNGHWLLKHVETASTEKLFGMISATITASQSQEFSQLLEKLTHNVVMEPITRDIDNLSRYILPVAADYNTVHDAVSFLKHQLSNGDPSAFSELKTAIINYNVDGFDILANNAFEIKGRVPLASIPHFHFRGRRGNIEPQPCLSLAKYNNSYLLVVNEPAGYASESADTLDLTFLIRVLGVMGVKQVVHVSSLLVWDQTGKIGAGSVFRLEDHINFTGINPLFGKNADRWGPRFPDMSQPYTPLPSEAEAQDLARLKVFFSLQRTIYSPVELEAINKLGAHGLASVVVPENIICQHMGIKSIAVGVVVYNAATDSAQVPSASLRRLEHMCAIAV